MGSGKTRWPHLKLYPGIRVQCSPRSVERHAEDSNPDAYNVAASRGSTVTSFTAPGVGGGIYYVRIRGKNGCGVGAASNEIVVVVP